MKKILIILMLFFLIGCQQEINLFEDDLADDLVDDNKIEIVMSLGDVSYSGVIYSYQYKTYSYDYNISNLIANEEVFSKSISVFIGDDSYSYIKEDNSWLPSYAKAAFDIDIYSLQYVDLDWFEEINPQEYGILGIEYNMAIKDNFIDDVNHLIYGDYSDDIDSEEKNVYLVVDEFDNIVSAYLISYPSFELSFVECDEIIPLPQEIIDYIQIERGI